MVVAGEIATDGLIQVWKVGGGGGGGKPLLVDFCRFFKSIAVPAIAAIAITPIAT